ncbi:MAG: Crp/Fnr family transcriptional regulator [Burkholderiales bacterium]|nr:Crp/Fnr family transcriptional regulator [Burkholderiales bacterium]
MTSDPSDARTLAADIRWLDVLTGAERDRAWKSLRFARADAGAFVCRQGERIAGWVGVLEGLVRVASTDESGCTTTITGVLAGGWFGEGTVLKREPCRYHAQALCRCRLAILPAEGFDALLASSLRFNRFVMDQLNERLSQFIGAREWERLRRPDLRVACQLTQLHNAVLNPRAGTLVKLRQQELADLAGLSRQCVNRSLAQLQERGLVRVQYGGVQVLDAAALAREVEAGHG